MPARGASGSSLGLGSRVARPSPVPRVAILLLTVSLMQSALIATTRTEAPSGARLPSIILIMADDLGYGDLSSYGQQRFRTPAIDRMASEGMRFTQYYAGSTVCRPSRFALMTGYHVGHGHIRDNSGGPYGTLREQDRTVAEYLRGAGYVTGMFGKWALGDLATTGSPERKGFVRWFGFLDQGRAHRHTTTHLWSNGTKVFLDPESDYVHDRFFAEAFDFIRTNHERPFFLYLPVTIPHAELRVPRDSLQEYLGKFPETPFRNPRADRAPEGKGYRSQPFPRAAYAAMISRLDRDVGRLLSLLSELGIDNDTIVFFTSDNGPSDRGGADPRFFRSTGGLRGMKGDLYEGGIRVPMIVRWPGHIDPGVVSDHVWAAWDFLPTAAEFAGITTPSAIDGVSVVPTLLGRRQVAQSRLYWESYLRKFSQALRNGDWKIVRDGFGRPAELYNLAHDPGETVDLATQRPELVLQLEAEMHAARDASDPRWEVTRFSYVSRRRLLALLGGSLLVAGLLGWSAIALRRMRGRRSG